VVLPQTILGQISIEPWTDQPPPREKREKNKLNNKEAAEKKKKRHVAKRAGHPELQSGRGAIPHGTVNKL
jgi:hypothetical protein